MTVIFNVIQSDCNAF